MANTLHIVNGDNTATILSRTTIKGDVIVWREMLCEGPLDMDVGSDEFWKIRYDFYENDLGIKKLDYFDKSIKEIIKIEDLKEYDEVVLWFEFDLFCQVNLMALCSYLIKSYQKDIRYYLVCTGKDENSTTKQYLSDYQPESWQRLFDHRIKINKKELYFGRSCWDIYVKNNLEELQNFDFGQNFKFPYFQAAIQQHLKRFPGENGLNQIENKIIELIQSNILIRNEIIRKLLQWQENETVYGFDDLQYALYLKRLDDLYFMDKNIFKLNQKGVDKFSKIKA